MVMLLDQCSALSRMSTTGQITTVCRPAVCLSKLSMYILRGCQHKIALDGSITLKDPDRSTE